MTDDTIAAIATPPGEGGLAVIRISGPEALAIADRIFHPAGKRGCKPSEAPTHTLHYGHIHRQGQRIDEVLLAVMRRPRTYTREDVVEISCHGGPLVTRLVLQAVLEAGARHAQPGEFTRRAFLNGRLDLTQAEAVADFIAARTERALAAARAQLGGGLSRRLHQLRDELMLALAHVEAQIDFPEDDLATDTREAIIARLEAGLRWVEELLRTAEEGQILRQGIRAAIVGRPNVGKSSLLNLLLGQERAIVSPRPGTTRDTIEETANIRGIPVVLVDTAGVREARDEIEQEGIRRSHQAVTHADLLLHVLDRSEPWTAEDQQLWTQFARRRRLVVLNKADLPARLVLPETSEPRVEISCRTGEGLENLKSALENLIWSGRQPTHEASEACINQRHQGVLLRVRQSLVHALTSLRAGLPLDLVAVDMRAATDALGELVGQTATEDLLDLIFSRFCIGK
ncbi:MAG: tRNA uridine-5-carboxymethylaminomethyl(34) synthesis GTPase MnmE [Verrucomicrobiota bacterium]|nr:tRNA uridine-5-carboxymethylaminomethyl(34) synthesis GTPase MnmE [Limisphaera sp.]MDW8380915.1 tRNA uridine-5-carboxymethylaminomethyl(34) synthesis GTPase MnmE [Verrucomicrobiota bacterium]